MYRNTKKQTFGKEWKMNIILINPIGPDPPPIYYGPPYGLAIIAAVMEKCGKNVSAMTFDRENYEEMISLVFREIKKKKPKYIGISCQSTSRGITYKMISDIKKQHPNIVIIVGGPFASQMPNIYLEQKGADYVIVGPGEETMNELIDSLENDQDIMNVNGVVLKRNNKILKTNKRKLIANIDELPFPAFHLFDVKKKLRNNKDFVQTELGKRKLLEVKGKRCSSVTNSLMLLSSIGCIYSCSFCPMSKSDQPKYRYHSPEYFVNMIEKFKKDYNQKHFVFGDNFFTCLPKRTEAICDIIIKRGLDIEWVCMTRTDYVTPELLTKMKEAGCIEISFGVESCSHKVQKKIKKHLSPDSVKNAFKWCNEIGIRSVLMLMVGNEGESDNTILETLRFIRELEPDIVQVKKIKVYPGTKIHDNAIKSGIIKNNYYLTEKEMPPVYTVENSIDKIEEWKSMFKLRDITIELQKDCNNNCSTCQTIIERNLSTEEAKEQILKVMNRCNTITFSGGDPLIRNDIFEILDFCKKTGTINILIRTNARMCSYKKIVEELTHYNIQGIIVPFFSNNPKIHEKITKNNQSFKQTLKGIEELTNSFKVIAEIPILEDNYRNLDETIKFIMRHQIKNFKLIYDPKKYDSPTLINTEKSLNQTLKTLTEEKANVCLNGIPYCIVKEHEKIIDEIKRPFDEIHNPNEEIISIGKERRKQRIHKKECKDCSYNHICEGFWR